MSKYLCYDVKSIQSFIFTIPKLKYIIGGSALVDKFDKETIRRIDLDDSKLQFSGGGKGAFLCDSDAAIDKLKEKIIEEAHEIGLDIRFGINEDFCEASQNTEETYPFIPKMNNGYPCPVSGLYPVENNVEHSVVRKRLIEENYRHYENKLLPALLVQGRDNTDLEFFRNVKADDGKDGKDGAEALGNRNRWVIIAMDGNDMGMQFRHQVKNYKEKKLTTDEMQSWIKEMSLALDDCSNEAVVAGIKRVVNEWVVTPKGREVIERKGKLTLPIRPLIVGGDDIIVLCHCDYAMTFVKEVMSVFEKTSSEKAKLWPATNGKLTITAGILYASVTLPLHTAIAYAESLLVSAKTSGRKNVKEGEPAPACLDWEQITDTVIDTPDAKRQRELLFFDEELGKNVKLTKRPYMIAEYTKIEALAGEYGKIPRTIRHKILPALSKGYSERLAFAAEIKKNHKNTLFKEINEFAIAGSRWEENKSSTEISTDVIDALMLLEEDTRMEKETINE